MPAPAARSTPCPAARPSRPRWRWPSRCPARSWACPGASGRWTPCSSTRASAPWMSPHWTRWRPHWSGWPRTCPCSSPSPATARPPGYGASRCNGVAVTAVLAPTSYTVDPWDPGYGVAYSDDLDGREPTARLDLAVELAPESWRPVSPGCGDAPAILFLDGVRRIDARVWVHG